ncbi:MAG: PEGA domain-containing protein, partial [Spirochaetaceae bacterium]|nr:PEGA domain-containing protein [Spirochaetaceae bacterium]
WFKVEPGLYTIVSNENIEITPGIPDSVQVPPASVVLAPFLLERSEAGIITRRLNEEIRQRAGSNLTLHANHPLWLGHDLIGFGTLRPALDPESLQFRVGINSNPEEAEIYVDDVLAGTTPIEFSLTGGKHRVLIRKEDFEDAVYYVRLEGDADIDAVLAPSAAVAMEGGSERYSTLVAPFYSMTEPNEQLARLFADTLLLTLEDDDRLDVSPSAIPWIQRDSLIHPDYLPLEEIGADLMVSGFFIEIDGRLNIQANLYDVQAETIRASVTWFGTAGMDIFDAMDEIALEFAREVDRVLPAAGRTLITRHETVYSGVDRSEGLIARKKIIRKRWVDNPNVLTVQSGFGGVMERFILSDGGSTSNVMRFD